MRVVSKIHAHYMERFSHWETGLGKYAISWGAYKRKARDVLSRAFWWAMRDSNPQLTGYEKIHDTKKLILLLKATNKAIAFHKIFM